jgi:hypothetical protein
MLFSTYDPKYNQNVIHRVSLYDLTKICQKMSLFIILILQSQKKPPHSLRGSRNSDINPKKEKNMCAVGFYEDLTVQTNQRVHVKYNY